MARGGSRISAQKAPRNTEAPRIRRNATSPPEVWVHPPLDPAPMTTPTAALNNPVPRGRVSRRPPFPIGSVLTAAR
jgi:hypothetical protein